MVMGVMVMLVRVMMVISGDDDGVIVMMVMNDMGDGQWDGGMDG